MPDLWKQRFAKVAGGIVILGGIVPFHWAEDVWSAVEADPWRLLILGLGLLILFIAYRRDIEHFFGIFDDRHLADDIEHWFRELHGWTANGKVKPYVEFPFRVDAERKVQRPGSRVLETDMTITVFRNPGSRFIVFGSDVGFSPLIAQGLAALSEKERATLLAEITGRIAACHVAFEYLHGPSTLLLRKQVWIRDLNEIAFREAVQSLVTAGEVINMSVTPIRPELPVGSGEVTSASVPAPVSGTE
jgi:hypothetical protein